MLTEIALTNFMSYDEETIPFGSDRAIAITGSNGAGKSTLVEAIVFGYWGIGRVPVADMVRKDSQNGMRVVLRHWDKKRRIEIERGRTMNGKGFVRVLIDGEVHVEGNETKAWIEKFLGMNQETFLLTSYYGSAGGRLEDRLMDTVSSERWDTFQKIARLTLFQRAEKRTKEKKAAVARELIAMNSRLQTMRETCLEDTSDIEGAISRETDRIGVLRDRLEEWKRIERENADARDALKDERTKLGNWEGALEKLRSVQTSKLSTRKESERKEKLLWSTITNINSTMDSKKQRVISKEERLKLDAQRKECIESASAARSMVNLYRQGTDNLTSKGECPLCKHTVSTDTAEKWAEAAERLVKSAQDMDRREKEIVARVETSLRAEREIAADRVTLQKVESEAESLHETVTTLDKEILALEERIDTGEQKIKEQKQKVSLLAKSVDGTGELDVHGAAKELGNAEANLNTLKDDLADEKRKQKEIAALTKEQESLSNQDAALTVLLNAFGKYGIPNELLGDMISEVERLATECYQNFDAGEIHVDVSEGEKPGIDFSLIDRKGKRNYEALSAGEKVMVYVSVRTAVSQIMSGSGAVNIDWLILDEIMGNLTPENRDNMMRVVSGVLRKMFPKLLMVSHVEVRDVFDRMITVQAENGVSHAV